MTTGRVIMLSALTVMGGTLLASKLNLPLPGFKR